MKNIILSIMILFTIASSAFAGVSSGMQSRMLVLSQSASWNNVAGILNTNMKAATVKPLVVNGFMTQNVDGSQVTNAASVIGSLPNKDFYTLAGATGVFQENCLANGITIAACPIPSMPQNNLTDAMVMLSAKNAITSARDAFSTSVVSFINKNGIDNSWIQFSQQVHTLPLIGGKLRTKYISFVATINASGAINFPKPQLIDVSPLILFATYVPKAVTAGLPQGWAYPNAGVLTYELRDDLFNIVSGTQSSINVNGAYDEPSVAANTPFDPDAGLKCLHGNVLNSASNCTSVRLNAVGVPYTDIKTLVGNLGASYSIVDYVRKVQPVYCGPGSTPNNCLPPVGPTNTAQTSINVTSRTLTWNGCLDKVDFNVKSSIGFTLAVNIDRTRGATNGAWGIINKFQSTNQSKPMLFDDTIVVNVATANSPSISTAMIDPFTKAVIQKSTYTAAVFTGFAGLFNSGNQSTILASWSDGTRNAEVGCDLTQSPVRIKFKQNNFTTIYGGSIGISSQGYGGNCPGSWTVNGQSGCNNIARSCEGGSANFTGVPQDFITGTPQTYAGFLNDYDSSSCQWSHKNVTYNGVNSVDFGGGGLLGSRFCNPGTLVATWTRLKKGGVYRSAIYGYTYTCTTPASSTYSVAYPKLATSTTYTKQGIVAKYGTCPTGQVKLKESVYGRYYCYIVTTTTAYCPTLLPTLISSSTCSGTPQKTLVLSW